MCAVDTCRPKVGRASRAYATWGGLLHAGVVAGKVCERSVLCSRAPPSAWSSSAGTDDTQLRIHAEPLRPPVVDLAPDPSPSGEQA